MLGSEVLHSVPLHWFCRILLIDCRSVCIACVGLQHDEPCALFVPNLTMVVMQVWILTCVAGYSIHVGGYSLSRCVLCTVIASEIASCNRYEYLATSSHVHYLCGSTMLLQGLCFAQVYTMYDIMFMTKLYGCTEFLYGYASWHCTLFAHCFWLHSCISFCLALILTLV